MASFKARWRYYTLGFRIVKTKNIKGDDFYENKKNERN